MTKTSKRASVKIILSALLVCVLVISSFAFSSSALENVYTTENPELTLEHIFDARAGGGMQDVWKPTGTLSQSAGKYNLTSNSWCFWSNYDALDFAYTEAGFNTGAGSILTASVKLDSYKSSGSYSSTGLMIRESLAANGRGVFLFVRGSNLYLMYRQGTSGSGQLPYTHFQTTINYPLELKMVVNKDRKKVYGYITSKGGKETPIGPISFDAANKLYIGIATHSLDRNKYDESVYSSFKIKLDAPEGWEYEEEEGTSSSPEEENKDPEVVLPEDLPVTENTLLKETFTNGFLTEDPEGNLESATTPVWAVRSGKPIMALDDDKTNRYLKISSLDDPLMMTAGDMSWTDYKASFEFTYSSELTSLAESNTLQFLVRHRSVVIGGSGEYSVKLVNKFSSNGDTLYGQYLQLYYGKLRGTFIPISNTVLLKEVQLVEGGMLPFDTTHKLMVEVFDDTIKVYLNGELLITYPETDDEALSRADKRNMNLIGNIGFYAVDTSVDIDNITVLKLNDVLGGDYDNKIAGKFDDPIPDYIADGFMKE